VVAIPRLELRGRIRLHGVLVRLDDVTSILTSICHKRASRGGEARYEAGIAWRYHVQRAADIPLPSAVSTIFPAAFWTRDVTARALVVRIMGFPHVFRLLAPHGMRSCGRARFATVVGSGDAPVVRRALKYLSRRGHPTPVGHRADTAWCGCMSPVPDNRPYEAKCC
jgi:hypothetical protein